MPAHEFFALAFHAVVAHRLRSTLTMLGILIGVAAVILLTSIGEGLRHYVLSEFTQFGTNLLAVSPGKTRTTGAPGSLGATVRRLTIEDAEALWRVPGVERVAPIAFGFARVEHERRGRSVFIYGATAELPAVLKFEVGAGRFLPDRDPRRGAPLVVLGPKLKREIFAEQNPLGQYIRIGGRRFLVIGVMAPKGRLLGFDIDDSAYVPVATAQQLFNRPELQEIDVSYSPGLDARSVAARVRQCLAARHDGEEDFTIITQTEMLDVLGRVLDIVNIAVGSIGGISLLVGAIGILTMMWISVNERRAEIGLVKAIGASGRQILTLFLLEAMLLSLAGGGAGVLAGLGIAALLRLGLPGLPVHTPVEYVVAALVVSLLVGLLSGVLPARRAAALDPLEALRAE